MILQTYRESCPLAFDDPDDFRRLREVLARANYTDVGVLEVLTTPGFSAPRGSEVPALLWRTRQGTALDTLIRLFLVGVPTEVETTRRALHPMTLEQWAAAGLLALRHETVVALVKLLPFHGLLLAFDLFNQRRTNVRTDFVMGIGSSTLTLANLAIRRPARYTLDLGTGCGTQAFLAAPHSERVYAVDRNPRACGFAAFNARLNDFTNIECYEGDLFEPVQSQQFDLVLSNPPFVISPASHYLFRDSGMRGDEICQKIVRQAPQVLTEGGYCQILCNWAHIAGERWQDRLATWFEGTGCDAWVLRSETQDASTYATTWIRETEADDPVRVGQLYEEWMAYYERERIEAMSAGLITMRRRSGAAHWFRTDDSPARMLGPCGDDVLRVFAAQDFLTTLPDDQALLTARLSVAPQVRWEQHCAPAEQGWQVIASHVRLAQGLTYSGDIDPYVANLVTRCNGQRPLHVLLADVAAALDSPLERIAPVCLEAVRRLIAYGFLLPAPARAGEE